MSLPHAAFSQGLRHAPGRFFSEVYIDVKSCCQRRDVISSHRFKAISNREIGGIRSCDVTTKEREIASKNKRLRIALKKEAVGMLWTPGLKPLISGTKFLTVLLHGAVLC